MRAKFEASQAIQGKQDASPLKLLKYISTDIRSLQLILYKGGPQGTHKRYDWIAQTVAEAKEIVDEVTRAVHMNNALRGSRGIVS